LTKINIDKKELLTAIKEGQFLKYVGNIHYDGREKLVELLIELHNEKTIDIVSEYMEMENSSDTEYDFFLTRDQFEKALPYLQADIERVMKCAVRLTTIAGEDLAAGSILTSVTKFCNADLQRAIDAMHLLESDPLKYALLLRPILSTLPGDAQKEGFNLVNMLSDHENIDVRIRAYQTYGELSLEIETAKQDLVSLAGRAEKEKDGNGLGTIIQSVLGILAKHPTCLQDSERTIQQAISRGDSNTLAYVARALLLNGKDVPRSTWDICLKSLLDTPPQDLGTLKSIGTAFQIMDDGFQKTNIITFIESYLLKNEHKISIKVFDGFVHKILNHDLATLNHILTKWFLTGNYALGTAVHDIIQAIPENRMELEIDPSLLSSESKSVEIIFIAHKVVGFLFIYPELSSSLIISLMKETIDPGVLDELGKLLVYPLLLNYPGKTKEYLLKVRESHPREIQSVLDQSLQTLQKYQENINKIAPIPELQPSSEHREISQRRFSREVNKFYKEAMKGSIASLFRNRVILYGNSSILQVENSPGETKRSTVKLEQHSTSMEYPRLDILEPYDFDLSMRKYRAESWINK